MRLSASGEHVCLPRPVRVVVLLVLGVLAAGCGGSSSTSGPPAASGPAASPAASPAGEGSVSVEHAMGTTQVGCTPERVVTLGQGQTDTTLALGVTPVGVVEPWTEDFYDYLPDAVGHAEPVGTELEPDLEAIAALQPDVILGSKLRHEDLYDKLSGIAPTVFAETIGVAWKDNVSLWAQALCRQETGEELLADWEQRTDRFARQAGDLADTQVSLPRFMPDQVRIYVTGFPGSVIRDAGLQRPPAQQVEDWEDAEQVVEISQERIPEMDGDVMFVMTSNWTADDAVERKQEWVSHPLWQKLSVVRNDAVFPVNEEHWNLGGGILAANAMLDDLEAHFLQPGGARAALTGSNQPTSTDTASTTTPTPSTAG